MAGSDTASSASFSDITPPEPLIVTLGDNPARRLDKALAKAAPPDAGLSRSRIARLLEAGAVTYSGAPVAPKDSPRSGAYVIALPPTEPMTAAPEPMTLSIVYEDEDVIVVDKPAGLVVHPAPGTPRGTLVNGLLHHCGTGLATGSAAVRPGIVHRIDKDTSGLLVVAKTDAAHQGLAAQFAAHTVARRYVAFCRGIPSPGDARILGLRGVRAGADGTVSVTTFIARHPGDRKRMAVTTAGRHAVTHLRTEQAFTSAARITCHLETGRTHQIRVHAAYLGHGLIGDPSYGGGRVATAALAPWAAEVVRSFPRQALHAGHLGFVHPRTRAHLSFDAPLPDDLRTLESALSARGA
ncbi:MAG: pseudouridine synthase [Pseudomonadota bacterium]